MDQAYSAFGQPSIGFFTMLLIGALAGWIAGKVVESRHGLFTNILVGIAGSFVGSTLAGLLQIAVEGFWRVLFASIIGAIVILVIWGKFRPTL